MEENSRDVRYRTTSAPRLRQRAISVRGLQDMGFMRNTSAVRNHFVTTEAKKKLLRPCQEARVLGL
jgi:hypothetical protein